MKYATYNKLYKNGKAITRAFRSESASTKKAAETKNNASNKTWNRKVGGRRGITAKMVNVRKVKR